MLEIISIIIGGIGAITGVISLIWHLINSTSRLKHDSTSFTLEQMNTYDGEIGRLNVEMRLRNTGAKDTTIEHLWITLANRVNMIKEKEGTKIDKHSSKTIKFVIDTKKEEFDKMFGKPKKIKIFIGHTFGEIRKEGKTSFRTPWLTIS